MHKALIGLVMLAAVPGRSLAQGAPACDSADAIARCPGQCAAACEDPSVYASFPDQCEAAFAATPASDDPAMCAADAPPPNTLNACIATAGTAVLEPNEAIRRLPDRLAFFNDFFSEMPTCAVSPVALTGMVDCLDEEANVITSAFGGLDTVEADPSDPDSLIRAVCSLSEATIRDLDVAALDLSERAKVLRAELGRVSQCRNEYNAWLNTRSDFCSDSTFRLCQSTANFYSNDLQKQLELARDRNAAIDTVVKSLEESLDLILLLSLIEPSARPQCD